ncbi:proton-coupled folate transporter-like [Saccoglossus kowalevskii]|uniref:Proton-coupled folate transporter n=1 Tax=Saccoglossus kowalevskii TaxID=10224 RepID=A0ABM0M866_SACKO|nr:PREDICTED: proton-coupled folate transporter-like [Saccoglossus kowalevskii]
MDASHNNSETEPFVAVRRRNIHRTVTVEPAVFFFMLAYSTGLALRVQYIQFVVSDNHNVTASLSPTEGGFSDVNGSCVKLNESNPKYETNLAIQRESSHWILYLDVVSAVLSFLSGPIIGSWSDKSGRKLACCIPTAGLAVCNAVYLIVYYLHLPLEYLFIGEIIRGGTGNFFTTLSGFFAYIADITTEKQRTYRIVIVQFMSIISAGLGQIGIGFWLSLQGFGPPYMLTIALLLCTLLYVVFLTTETILPDHSTKFTVKQLVKDITLLVRLKTNGRQWRLAILSVDIFILNLIVNSAFNLTVLHVKDYPFCWSTILIGYFVAAQLVLNALGMVIGGKLLSVCFSDLGMVQSGTISYIAALLIIAFCNNHILMFIAAIAGALSFLPIPVLRARCSKLVTESEQGTLFACIGCIESLAMCFSPIIFNNIYSATVSAFSGSVFCVMAACLVISLCLTIVVQLKEPRSGYIAMPDKNINKDDPVVN